MQKKHSIYHFLIVLSVLGFHCNPDLSPEKLEYQQAFRALQDWNLLLLDLNKNAEGYRPPVSARMFAYAGLAAWESSVPALPHAQSLAPQLKGLVLPSPIDASVCIPSLCLDAAYRTLIPYFYAHGSASVKEKCLQLSAKHYKTIDPIDSAKIQASIRFGTAVAEAICHWSATDSVGHQAHLLNYDRDYRLPEGNGLWRVSETDPMLPLLPHWGGARTFCTVLSDMNFQAPIEFSDERGSPFFAQAMEVYSVASPITDEKRWIAEFWSDDFPGLSFCAASRWISIARQAVEQQRTSFPLALETYLKVGLALNDAAVNCWFVKYHFSVERPDSYIRRHIQKDWLPLHDAPPFPSYPSGHASFGAAAKVVLETLLGKNLGLTDRSHESRKEFSGAPRRFDSFNDMAIENALSRIYMGVHYRMDCEEGLRLGTVVGEKAATLSVWKSALVTVK